MWAEQTGRLERHQKKQLHREMGRGTWSDKDRRLDQARRRREREQRKLQRQTAQRNYGRAVAIGALILSAVLLMFPGTRGAGLMMLILAGLLLYLIIGRKRA
jgi:hypothetical protein